MPRKVTKHTKIHSDKDRISTFKRRLDSFLKKGNELSILCGIQIAIVIHNPSDGYSLLWPSEEPVRILTEKYLGFPEREISRKMVLHEKFLADEIRQKSMQSLKLQQKIDEKEVKLIMCQLEDGRRCLESLDFKELNGVYRLAEEKLKGLERNEETDNHAAAKGAVFGEVGFGKETAPTAEATSTAEWNWLLKGNNNINNQGEGVVDMFSQDWSTYFS